MEHKEGLRDGYYDKHLVAFPDHWDHCRPVVVPKLGLFRLSQFHPNLHAASDGFFHCYVMVGLFLRPLGGVMTDPNTEAPDIAGLVERLRGMFTNTDLALFNEAARALEALQAERDELRRLVIASGTEAGAYLTPKVSMDMLRMVPAEINGKLATKDATIASLREALEDHSRDFNTALAAASARNSEIALLRAVVEAAREFPRETPAPGGVFTKHTFQIEAGVVWQLDKALKELEKGLVQLAREHPDIGTTPKEENEDAG